MLINNIKDLGAVPSGKNFTDFEHAIITGRLKMLVVRGRPHVYDALRVWETAKGDIAPSAASTYYDYLIGIQTTFDRKLLPIQVTRRAGGSKITGMAILSQWSTLPYTPNPQALALVKELDICL